MLKKALFLFLVIPLIFSGHAAAQIRLSANKANDPALQMQKFNQFYRYLSSSYIDTVNYNKLVEDAIKTVLTDLDPHSTYISAEDMEEVQQSFDGNFSGIGIEFNILNDTIFVVNTVPGGPSEKVGLLPNDKIVIVNGESVVGVKQAQVPKILRGPKGTQVDIRVKRGIEPELLDFRIIRDDIPITTVDASYLISDRTGYIRVNRFANNTMKEFQKSFKSLGKIDNVIIDLRGNGGGLLNEALSMTGYFLPKGSLLLTTDGMMIRPEKYDNPSDGKFRNGKVIVLIDEFSASGSEIVAGALQDWDRAVIIGRRSFGKGLVQRQYPLIDGSAVRITVARYHTPTGRVIQRPYENGNAEGYYNDLADRLSSDVDSMAVDSSQVYRTLRLGKVVYGGGGITPDIMVTPDTTGYSQYWSRLVRMGVMNEFVSSYLDRERTTLTQKYKKFEDFESGFEVTEEIMKELITFGEKRNVPFDQEGYKRSERNMKIQLKALLAQKLWSMTEYFRITNSQRDDYVKKALEILRNWDEEGSQYATDKI